LLDIELTEKLISQGQLIDYSVESNSNNIPAEFNSVSIDTSECQNSGKFKINGIFITKLNSDLNFVLPLSKPENIKATCSIKKGEKDSNGIIDCSIDSQINDEMIIDQNIIYDDNKAELLIIGAIKSNGNIKCSDGLLSYANNKINKNLSFRQVSHFSSSGNNIKFFLLTISTEKLSIGETIKLKIYLINKNDKEEKEINCILQSDVTLLNVEREQADFECSVEGNADDIEIISSDDITGINNNLEEYEKSPKKTDEIISETEKEDESGVGKLYDYYLSNYKKIFPTILSINKVESNLCLKHGKLTLKVSFDNDVKQEYEIDLS